MAFSASAVSSTEPQTSTGTRSFDTLLTVLVIGVLLGAGIWGWLRLRGSLRARHRRKMEDLRFPTLGAFHDEGFHARAFADFLEMLLVDVTRHYDEERARVYHLRRRDGPIWDILEEEDSLRREGAHIAEDGRRGLTSQRELNERIARNEDLRPGQSSTSRNWKPPISDFWRTTGMTRTTRTTIT
jgi:hypothetical protein